MEQDDGKAALTEFRRLWRAIDLPLSPRAYATPDAHRLKCGGGFRVNRKRKAT